MRLEIAKLHQRLGATMIYVTHDQVEAMTLADRIVVLEFGKIAQVGTPKELYERPQISLLRSSSDPKMNILPCLRKQLQPAAKHGGAFTGTRAAAHLRSGLNITIGAAGTGQCDGTVDGGRGGSFVVVDCPGQHCAHRWRRYREGGGCRWPQLYGGKAIVLRRRGCASDLLPCRPIN